MTKVVFEGPHRQVSVPLDDDSAAAKILLAQGWRPRVSPELPARKSNIDSHPEEQSVPDDTGFSLEVTQLTLQDEKLQPLNKALTQDSIEALIEAKLDDFDSLSATTDDWLNSVVGIKRTEIRKIRRVLEAQDAADAAL